MKTNVSSFAVLSMSLTTSFISLQDKNVWNSVKAHIIANTCVYTFVNIFKVAFWFGVATIFLQ